MYKEKKKLFIFSVLGLITSLVGVSYAFFKASVMGSESNSTIYGVAANLTIEFREGTSQISANDIFPGWSETKTFYIKNNNSAEGEYSLKLFDVENGFMEESISFEITSTNDGASIEKRNLPASNETLEPVIVIAGNTTQEYTVKVYYNNLDVDQSADLGQSFTFKIGIDKAGYEMTNLIVNGDFSDGANGWSTSLTKNAENTVSGIINDKKYSTGKTGSIDWEAMQNMISTDNSTLRIYNPNGTVTTQYYSVLVEHKIYVKLWAMYTGLISRESKKGIAIYNNDKTVADQIIFVAGDFENNYSILYSSTEEDQYIALGGIEWFGNTIEDDDDMSEVLMHFDDILVVDLTETFGSGNEPTKEWCDANIEWFDGTTIINK